MAISWDSFDKIWASTSPLTPYSFSDPNYAQGWNFVGSTPPARQMWDSIQKQNDEKFKYLRDNFGTPNIVTSSSQMTDTEKVYVYMGSEAGWNNGHWYYYDEGTSSWADGGVYNSVAFVTDTTLSIAGQPADAKATGDALALKSDLAGCTFTGNVSVNADFSVTGDAVIGTDLSVAGDSTLTGNVSASGDVNATGDVTADNISATTNGTIGGALSVAGASTLTGNVSAGADITVVGDVSSANIIASNNANIGGNLSVSGTTALAGTSTAPTPSADDNSTKIATTEYVQKEIKPIETDVDIADKRISNIEKLLQGHLYDYQTDTTSAYTKSVPSGAMPYAGLEKVGGKTLVFNQLVDSGTTTVSTISGHKYYTLIDGTASIVTSDGTAITIVDDTADMVVDLTLMFGSGNEPSTTADFTAIFGATHYSYNAGTLLSAGVTEVVSKDSNNATLQTYSIPASIQALEGYGWSAGSVYNYIDFERKVFVQNVGMVVLDGTQTSRSGNFNTPQCRLSYDVPNVKLTGALTNDDDCVIADYLPNGNNTKAVAGTPCVFRRENNTSQIFVSLGSIGISAGVSDTAGFNSYLSTHPLTVYYALETPTETDISAYLTDDNLISVESGGTLIFENQHGDDYLLPVPSDVTYMIDLQEAINNG